MTSIARIAERVFPCLAALIALLFAWMGIGETLEPGPRPLRIPSVLFALSVALLFGLAAVAVWRRWRLSRVMTFVCVAATAAFMFSMLNQGWEDQIVFGSLLFAYAAIAAALGLILCIHGLKDGAPWKTRRQ